MSDVEHIQRGIDYIEQNISLPIRVERVAEEAMMSLPHLYRVFYSLTGHTVKDYIRKRRMSLAAEHLKRAHLSVLEIALEVGFETHASFSKAFKKIVGMTPGIYRNSDLHYCFERINLFEQVHYLEYKDVSERYLNVKVNNLSPMTVFRYIHRADHATGIEQEALKTAIKQAERLGIRLQNTRLFGYSRETDRDTPADQYTYSVLIQVKDNHFDLRKPMESTDWQVITLQGGLHAVSTTDAESEETIVNAWNQLVSEWLPRSMFNKRGDYYLEEYLFYRNDLTRMKIYLPLRRKTEPDMIQIVERKPVRIVYYRAYGSDAEEQADQHFSDWLRQHAIAHKSGKDQLFVSYFYGSDQDQEHWHEYGVPVQNLMTADPEVECKKLAGGAYACLNTDAYGNLQGVLEIMHRWIIYHDDYQLDDSRQWYATYHPSPEQTAKSVSPVIFP